MADIIQFMTAQQLLAETAKQSALVSGMTAAEAAAATGATATSAGGASLYTFNATTAAGASNIINFPGAATAAQASSEFLAAGGTTSAAGAATGATGSAAATGNFTLIEGGAAGSGTSGVAGLLSVNLPTAAAALAPVAGVGLGVGLYELNPGLWEKISRALLPFCYPDTELMPVTVDDIGNTYYPQGSIDAMKDVLATIGIGSVSSDNPFNEPAFTYVEKTSVNYDHPSRLIYSTSSTGESRIAVRCVNGSPNKSGWFINSYPIQYYLCSQGTCELSKRSFTFDGKTVYWNSNPQNGIDNGIPPLSYVAGTDNLNHIAWLMWYQSEYIDASGTEKWGGQTYPDGVTPMNVQTGVDEEGKPIYTPYYPVTTPIGDPGASENPATNPNPSTNPNPYPAIQPWITPQPAPSTYPEAVPESNPAPLPNPVPAPQPVPAPGADPSVYPDPNSPVPGNPTQPDAPKDGQAVETPPEPTIPVIPVLPSAATGLLHVYNPTQAQLNEFGSWLWTTFSGNLIDTLSKLFSNPMEAIIGLHELYATPSVSGEATIRAGYLDSQVPSSLVGDRYTSINCGTVVVEEYYQNYLDYSPYTQCYIYLPFIGIVTVSADDIIGNAVNIIYHIDSYTGCVIAAVTVARQGYSATVYQFEGNCAVEIPITSGYQSTYVSGLLGLTAGLVTGNPASVLGAAHLGRAGLGKNAVQHSGSFGSSYGAMGSKVPYIIVRRPTQKIISNYSKLYGYPAHKMVYLGNCSGYTRIKEVQVMSTTATNKEKEMILNLLKSGIYIN